MYRFADFRRDVGHEPTRELADLHREVERYWDSGKLPESTPCATLLPQLVAKAHGRSLPKHLRKYLFELPEAAVRALERAWYLSEVERDGRIARHWNRPGPCTEDGVELTQTRTIVPLHAHYEVRATIPFWGGHQSVELTFRQLSRREPMEQFADVLADYKALQQDEVERSRCDHPACRTPNCPEPHWMFGPSEYPGALQNAQTAVMELFDVHEATLLAILLPRVYGCTVSCRKVRVPMRCTDERYAPSLFMTGFRLDDLKLPFALGYDTNVNYQNGPSAVLGPESEPCPPLLFASGGIGEYPSL